MIETPLGLVEIEVNQRKISYRSFRLPKKAKSFCVDGRYGVLLEGLEEGTQLWIRISFDKSNGTKQNVEPGEQLSLISFETATTKVSIGTTGDIPKVFPQYLDNGLYLDIQQSIDKLPIVVAWKHIVDDYDGVDTWLAADPAFMETECG